jgi:CheY-specific phosphatase CheX
MTMLTRSISNVLETMFFLPIKIEEEGPGADQWMEDVPNLIGARVDLKGPFTGCAFFVLSETVVAEMAANFLGIPQEEATPDQQADTLKEALNMIAGHMLSLYDTEGKIQLGIPEMLAAEDISLDKLAAVSQHSLLIATEDSRMLAGILGG